MESIKDIIEGCRQADRRSQFRLYERCYPFMMSVAMRYKKSNEEAASVVNLSFLKVLNNLINFDESFSLNAWLRRITINTIIDEFRKDKKINALRINVDYEKEITLNGIHVDFNHAEIRYNAEELLQYVHELNVVTASVFNLFVMDGYSHKDISDLLSISESASKWHLFTARKQLQEKVLSSVKKNTNQPLVSISKSNSI